MAGKEVLKFGAEVEKIFHLVIHSIYENKEIFLRELISNASDACDKLRYKSMSKDGLLGNDKEFKITIDADKDKKTLTISDNGVGMSRAEMVKNLGTIARSGTQNFLEKLSGESQKDVQLIGKFGVGFYSSFMVADNVTVYSKAAGGKKTYKWESSGTGEFTIEESDKDFGRGTVIVLHLRDEEEEYLDEQRIRHIVKTYSNHVVVPVFLMGENDAAVQINDGKALWLKNKSDITTEDYEEFYKGISNLGDDKPWLTVHNKVEGKIEYSNLLFIPSTKPFDLFHPDRMCRVKLYVKRVFIAEDEIDIIPAYLRFLRGVVDSEDLPLNISRETIQNSAIVQRMRTSITNRVLRDLKKKAEKEPEDYIKFWNLFGSVIKEGLCDGFSPRDDILEVCRFKTTKSDDKLISMKDYIANMKQDQKTIFFITGDNDKIMDSPQLEGFVAKGIEVLLLTDSVDEFWVNVLHEYEDIPLKSVTRASAELDEKGKEKADKSEGDNDDSSNEKSEIKELLEFMKKTIGEEISDVRETSKLQDSAVCLAVPDKAMDIRMERFMFENKQLPQVSAKILEVNPNHPIIEKLAQDLAKNESDEKLTDTVHLLFAQANIIEGEPLSDVGSFRRRMNDVLEKALAA